MKAVGVLVILVTAGACESEPDPYNVPPPPPACAEGASYVGDVCRCAGLATGAECPSNPNFTSYCAGTSHCETALPMHWLAGAADSSVFWWERVPPNPKPGESSVTYLVRFFPSTGASTIPRMTAENVKVDGSTIVLQSTFTTGQGTVLREIVACPDGDCSRAVQIATGDQVSMAPALLAAGGGTVHFLNSLTSEIVACPETGCTSPTTTPLPTASLGVSNWAADSTGLYFILGTSVFVVPPAGTATKIVTPDAAPLEIAVGTDVYFTTMQGQILSCPRAAATCTPTVFASSSSGGAITDLYTDATHLYWIENEKVLRCPLEGCGIYTPEPVASCHVQLFGNADFLYCTTKDAVLQISK